MSDKESTQSLEEETEDEEGLLLDEKVDKQIFNVLNALQNNDPSIYNRTRNFFDDEELKKLEKTDKSTLIHQYFANKVNESELLQMRKKALEEFHNAVHETMNGDEDSEKDEIFHRKVKTREDLEREEKEFQQFLKEQERKDKDLILKQSASLERYENDLHLSKEDEFLRDYLLNNRWIMKDDKKKKNKESGSFEELANELRSQNDSDYDSDGMQKDREFEELERKGQEEHLKTSKLPTLAEYRFEEKDADKIINYRYKSTEREKKITAKVRKDLNRKANKKKAEGAANENNKEAKRSDSILYNQSIDIYHFKLYASYWKCLKGLKRQQLLKEKIFEDFLSPFTQKQTPSKDYSAHKLPCGDENSKAIIEKYLSEVDEWKRFVLNYAERIKEWEKNQQLKATAGPKSIPKPALATEAASITKPTSTPELLSVAVPTTTDIPTTISTTTAKPATNIAPVSSVSFAITKYIAVSENAYRESQELFKKLDEDFKSYEQHKKDATFKNIMKHINRRVNQAPDNAIDVQRRSNDLINLFKEHKTAPWFRSCLIHCSQKLIDRGEVIGRELATGSVSKEAYANALTLAALCSNFEEFFDIFISTINKKCPYTIPQYYLQKPAEISEQEWKVNYLCYSSENEEKRAYYERMAGIVSLYAAFLQVDTGDDINFIWIAKAWKWLARFLNLDPVDISATLLDAFLRTAGWALHKKYKSQFMKLLNYIQTYYIPKCPKNTEFPAPLSTIPRIIKSIFNSNGPEKPIHRKLDSSH